MNYLFLALWYSLYCNIHNNRHKHFLTFLTPPPNIFLINLLITIRTRRFRSQPIIYTFRMKIMTTISHKQRIRIQTNRTYLFFFIRNRFRIPEHIRCIILDFIFSALDLYLSVVWIFTFFCLCVDLLGSASHSYKCADYESQYHTYCAADCWKNYSKNTWLLFTYCFVVFRLVVFNACACGAG